MNLILTAACGALQLDPAQFSAPMMLAFRRHEAARGVSTIIPALTAPPQTISRSLLRELHDAGQWKETIYRLPGAGRIEALCGELTTDAGTVTIFAIARGAPAKARFQVNEIRHDPASDAKSLSAYFRLCLDGFAEARGEAACS